MSAGDDANPDTFEPLVRLMGVDAFGIFVGVPLAARALVWIVNRFDAFWDTGVLVTDSVDPVLSPNLGRFKRTLVERPLRLVPELGRDENGVLKRPVLALLALLSWSKPFLLLMFALLLLIMDIAGESGV